MSQAKFLIGDVFAVMAGLPDKSVDLVMTSPPFLALRSYLPEGHPDKHLEIGSEPSPAEFIDTLLALTAEWGRLLAPHGSICVELGDTYSGSGGSGGDYTNDGLRAGQNGFTGSARQGRLAEYNDGRGNPATMRDTSFQGANTRSGGGDGWPLAKSMCGIPHLYHLSLAYGRNILTGKESPAGMWRVRNVVAWCRPNPPVGALGDKFRPATSYLTIATKNPKRYFDLDAVRQPLTDRAKSELEAGGVTGGESYQGEAASGGGYSGTRVRRPADGGGAPPLDWWEIPTKGYRGSHYAVYPPALLERPLKSMVPRKVCTTCGEPSRRITGEPTYEPSATNRGGVLRADAERPVEGVNEWIGSDGRGQASVVRVTETLGFTDCGHNTWRNGMVLDPFGGSGTTAAVATGLGVDAILIDLDERNADLARDRVGMFLSVTDTRTKGAA